MTSAHIRDDDNSDDEYDYLIKLMALGDSSVGKTCLLNRYANNQFNSRFTSTVGIDFVQKRVVHESRDSEGLLGPKQRLQLQLWDTAGQERDWMQLLCRHAYCERPDVILVGNKFDLSAERQVPLAAAQTMARELNIPYIETSAATGHQVTSVFDQLLDAVMHKIELSVNRPRVAGLNSENANLNKPANKSNCAC